MAVSEYPTEGKSLIPPRTLAKIERLNGTDRKVYIQELIGNYEARVLDIEQIAHRMAKTWCERQAYYLWQVHSELVLRMAAETNGVSY